MLAELGARHTIATTALESIIGFDAAQSGAKLVGPWRGLVAQPAGQKFSKRTAQYRRGLEFDAGIIARTDDCLEPHDVIPTACVRAHQTG